jgi:DASS family divalent anion:Na+ symporter
MNHSQAIHYFVEHDHLTADISREERSRLLNFLEVEKYDSDQEIFVATRQSDYLYYVVEGTVATYTHTAEGDEEKLITAGQYFGHEAGAAASQYIKTAIAKDRPTIIKIPADKISNIFTTNRSAARRFILDMFSSFTKMNITEDFLFHNIKMEKPISFWEIIGWLMTLSVPIAIYFMIPQNLVGEPVRLFCCITSISFTIWVFNLLPTFIPCILMLAAFMATGIAPNQVILGGFSSETFVMTVCIFALGSVIGASGVMYRFLLWILKYIPNTQMWINLNLFVIGLGLSFVVPSTASRSKLMTPYLLDMVNFTHLKPGTKEVTRMAISSFTGSSLFSSIFLNGSLHNFILLGLLWAQDQERFQWGGWLQAAAVTGGIFFCSHFLVMFGLCRKTEKVAIDRQRINQQYKILGKLSSKEWVAILSVVFFTIGVATSSLHRMSPSTLGLMVLLFMLSFDVLDKEDFQKSIDWPALLFLAGLIGLISVFNHLHLNELIVQRFAWIGSYIKENFALFVLILAVFISILRLFLPYGPTTVIVASLLIPIAHEYEVNAWVMCFIALILGKMWFFTYQYPPYQEMKMMVSANLRFNEKEFIIYNLFMNFIKIISLLLSIPYWSKFGLI